MLSLRCPPFGNVCLVRFNHSCRVHVRLIDSRLDVHKDLWSLRCKAVSVSQCNQAVGASPIRMMAVCSFRWGSPFFPEQVRTSTVKFPCGSRMDPDSSGRIEPSGVSYSVPAARGKTRAFHTFIKPKPRPKAQQAGAPPSLLSKFRPSLQSLLLMTTWGAHIFSHQVLDADIMMQLKVDVNR